MVKLEGEKLRVRSRLQVYTICKNQFAPANNDH